MRIDSLNLNKPCGVRRLVAAFAAPSGDKSPHSTHKRHTALISAAVTGRFEIPHEIAQQELRHAN